MAAFMRLANEPVQLTLKAIELTTTIDGQPLSAADVRALHYSDFAALAQACTRSLKT